ncbi:MAG: NAD-binding protein [Candidatus Aenigmarchaeota archaeon]|nr:NAD-binding protein [Candidatus Aenigmarchaeota archaeon]
MGAGKHRDKKRLGDAIHAPSINILLAGTIVLIIILSTTLVSMFDNVAIGDSFYWTLCSITSATCILGQDFYYLPTVRVFTVINGAAFIIIISFLAANIVDRLGRLDLRGNTLKRKLEDLKDHFIICGYGRVGEKISSVMRSNGVPFVVVDKDPETVKELAELGGLTVEGNVLDPRVLERAGIKRARGLIAVLNTDSDNISLVLTANDINPDILIGARADSEAAIRRLHRAGAEIVVLPEIVGGLQLAKEVLELEEVETHDLVSRKKFSAGN